MWRSPDSTESALAYAANSTALSGTPSASASRRNAATRSSGIAASCAATPAIGVRVHRGIWINPPTLSTPPQYSWSASVSTCMESPSLPGASRDRLSISNLTGRVSAPPSAGRNLFALHQEAVGGQLGAIADRHAVVDVGGCPEGDIGAECGVVRLEGAVFLRVALDGAGLVERAVVADRGERALRDTAAVIEYPAADPGAQSPQDNVDERGAGEGRDNRGRGHLPVAFMAPHRGLVNRAEQHGQGFEPCHDPVDQDPVNEAEHSGKHEFQRDHRRTKGGVEVRGDSREHGKQEHEHPSRE